MLLKNDNSKVLYIQCTCMKKYVRTVYLEVKQLSWILDSFPPKYSEEEF